MSQEKKYRLITLVGVVSFPQMPVACDIRRNASKASIFDAFENGDNVVFVTENPDMAKSNRTEPTLETVNKIGCLCHIMNVTEVGSTLKVQADGIERVEIKKIIVGGKYPYCTIGKVETTEIFGTTLNLLILSSLLVLSSVTLFFFYMFVIALAVLVVNAIVATIAVVRLLSF